MTFDEITRKLELLGREPVRNGWTAKDTMGDETYGLNISKIQKVAKLIDCDAILADELYASANHDLKVLATFIDQPQSYTKDELEKRSEQLYPSPFAEKFCRQVMARTDFAVHFIDKWTHCEHGDFRCYAYHTLAEIAKRKNNLADEFYVKYLEDIASKIHQEPDTVKDAMYNAMMSISCRDKKLRKKSFEVAQKIGNVSFEKGTKVAPAEAIDGKKKSEPSKQGMLV